MGATLKLYYDNKVYVQEQIPSRGFQSSMDYVMTIGLGTAKTIDSLRIIWPDDTAQKLTNTGLSPSLADLPKSFSFVFVKISQSYNPRLAVTNLVWAVPRSLATTNGITNCFLFLRVLRCFSSPGLPPNLSQDDYSSSSRVAPFGNLRIIALFQLPVAYRR